MRHVQGQDHVGAQLQEARASVPPSVWTDSLWGNRSPLLKRVTIVLLAMVMIGVGLFFVSLVFRLGYTMSAACAGVTLVAALILLGIGRYSEAGRFSSRAAGDTVARLAAGHRGEQAVTSALSALDDQWVLFSGVVVAGLPGDVDHLLVGPPGVFALEAKNWVGEIAYDDTTGVWSRVNVRNPTGEVLQDPAAQILRASQALQTLLERPVVPVVVFTHPHSRITGDHPAVVVAVLPQLVRWLVGQPPTLQDDERIAVEERVRQVMQE